MLPTTSTLYFQFGRVVKQKCNQQKGRAIAQPFC
jgi:hypothetical protein